MPFARLHLGCRGLRDLSPQQRRRTVRASKDRIQTRGVRLAPLSKDQQFETDPSISQTPAHDSNTVLSKNISCATSRVVSRVAIAGSSSCLRAEMPSEVFAVIGKPRIQTLPSLPTGLWLNCRSGEMMLLLVPGVPRAD